MVTEERLWLKNQLEQSHNILMLFGCRLLGEFEIKNSSLDEHTAGYVRCFEHFPANPLTAHKSLYGDIIDLFFKGELKWKT